MLALANVNAVTSWKEIGLFKIKRIYDMHR
jgi:hypothetical protein